MFFLTGVSCESPSEAAQKSLDSLQKTIHSAAPSLSPKKISSLSKTPVKKQNLVKMAGAAALLASIAVYQLTNTTAQSPLTNTSVENQTIQSNTSVQDHLLENSTLFTFNTSICDDLSNFSLSTTSPVFQQKTQQTTDLFHQVITEESIDEPFSLVEKIVHAFNSSSTNQAVVTLTPSHIQVLSENPQPLSPEQFCLLEKANSAQLILKEGTCTLESIQIANSSQTPEIPFYITGNLQQTLALLPSSSSSSLVVRREHNQCTIKIDHVKDQKKFCAAIREHFAHNPIYPIKNDLYSHLALPVLVQPTREGITISIQTFKNTQHPNFSYPPLLPAKSSSIPLQKDQNLFSFIYKTLQPSENNPVTVVMNSFTPHLIFQNRYIPLERFLTLNNAPTSSKPLALAPPAPFLLQHTPLITPRQDINGEIFRNNSKKQNISF